MRGNFFLDKIRTLCFTCACMFGVNSQAQESKGLKDYFQGFFPIGVSVSPQSLKGDEAKLTASRQKMR